MSKPIKPNIKKPFTLYPLAWHLVALNAPELRDASRAISLIESTLSTDEEPSSKAFSVLAAAYAEQGDFERSMDLQQKVLVKRGDYAEQALAQGMAPRRSRLY